MRDEAVEKKAEGPGPEDELPANSLQGRPFQGPAICGSLARTASCVAMQVIRPATNFCSRESKRISS